VTEIDFWFDPSCPYTWRTSRWLADVAQRRGVDVRWRVMSLAILNEGKEFPPQYGEAMDAGRVASRVMQAVRERCGNEALGRFYAEVGTLVHERGTEPGVDVYRQALRAGGLPEELATAGDDEAYQAGVVQSHWEGQDRAGQESGSPITAVDDHPGFFGPIVVPPPAGDDATRLLDALVALSAIQSFSELKRARQAL
jgi:hypothetical protein